MYNTNAFNIRLAIDKTAWDEIALIPMGGDPPLYVPVSLPLDLTWGDRTSYMAGCEASYALIKRNDERNGSSSFSLTSTDYLDPDDLPEPGYAFPTSSEIEAVEDGLKTFYSGCCEIARIGVELAPATLPFSPVPESAFHEAVSEWGKVVSPNKEDIRICMQRDARDGIDRLGVIIDRRFGIPVGKNCVFTISGDSGCAEMERSADGELKISSEGRLFDSSYLEYSVAKGGSEILLKDVPVSPYGIVTCKGGAKIYRGSADAFGKYSTSADYYLYGSCDPEAKRAGLVGVNSWFEDSADASRIGSELSQALYGWLYITCMLTGTGSAKDLYPFRLLCELLLQS